MCAVAKMFANVAVNLACLALLVVAAARWIRQDNADNCDMTWMNPQYIDTKLSDPRFGKYRLFRYIENHFSIPKLRQSSSLERSPVLFIHGNRGTYQHVRSVGYHIAAANHRLSKYKMGSLDVFSVDLNEEFSGLSGDVLSNQIEFVKICIQHILAQYRMDRNGVVHENKKIILVGHSMGGLIARAITSLSRDYDLLISISVSFSAPLRSVLPFEDSLQLLFKNSEASRASIDFRGAPFLGICGGVSDEFVSPSSCLQQETNHTLTIPTSNIVGSISNMRHYAIIWSFQLLDLISKSISLNEQRFRNSSEGQTHDRLHAYDSYLRLNSPALFEPSTSKNRGLETDFEQMESLEYFHTTDWRSPFRISLIAGRIIIIYKALYPKIKLTFLDTNKEAFDGTSGIKPLNRRHDKHSIFFFDSQASVSRVYKEMWLSKEEMKEQDDDFFLYFHSIPDSSEEIENIKLSQNTLMRRKDSSPIVRFTIPNHSSFHIRHINCHAQYHSPIVYVNENSFESTVFESGNGTIDVRTSSWLSALDTTVYKQKGCDLEIIVNRSYTSLVNRLIRENIKDTFVYAYPTLELISVASSMSFGVMSGELVYTCGIIVSSLLAYGICPQILDFTFTLLMADIIASLFLLALSLLKNILGGGFRVISADVSRNRWAISIFIFANIPISLLYDSKIVSLFNMLVSSVFLGQKNHTQNNSHSSASEYHIITQIPAVISLIQANLIHRKEPTKQGVTLYLASISLFTSHTNQTRIGNQKAFQAKRFFSSAAAIVQLLLLWSGLWAEQLSNIYLVHVTTHVCSVFYTAVFANHKEPQKTD